MAIFPLDITGQAATNRITGESIPIVPSSPDLHGPAAYVLVQYAPFFADNFVISHNGNTLVRGQHFDFIVQNIHAYKYIGKELYAGIYFYNRNISGNVIVSYNTLGDTWVQNNYQHVAQFFNTYFSQQMVPWDRVFGVPYQLPPIQHPNPLSSLKGVDDIVDAIESLKSAVEDTDSGPLTVAVNNLSQALLDHVNNPAGHGTGKQHIGLPDVVNGGEATSLEQIFSTAAIHYLTTGSLAKLRNIQGALLQNLTGVPTQNPLTSTSNILVSNTLQGFDLPEMPLTVDQLVIMQIRLPTTDAQRHASLQNVTRLQVGFGVSAGGSGLGAMGIRLLSNTGYVPWTLFPSANVTTLDDRYLRKEPFPITLTNNGVFQNGIMTVWELSEGLFMFECFFTVVNASGPVSPVVGTLANALRPRAGLRFRAEHNSISLSTNSQFVRFKIASGGQIRIDFPDTNSTGTPVGNYYVSGVYSTNPIS